MRRLLSSFRWAARHSVLAAGPVSRAWLFLTLLALPAKRRLTSGTPVPVRLRLGGSPRLFWFSDESELFALEEIFGEGEYAAAAVGRPTVIVDLGSNVGQAALWFRSRFPEARLLCVEPDPRTFATLTRNVGNDPLVTLRHAAVTAEDGPVVIERTPHSSWGTRVNGSSGNGLVVPGLSLKTLLADGLIDQVDVLKVDIEGMEHAALAASPALARARLVVGELHPDLLPMSLDTALEDMRLNGGFAHAELRGDIFVLSRET